MMFINFYIARPTYCFILIIFAVLLVALLMHVLSPASHKHCVNCIGLVCRATEQRQVDVSEMSMRGPVQVGPHPPPPPSHCSLPNVHNTSSKGRLCFTLRSNGVLLLASLSPQPGLVVYSNRRQKDHETFSLSRIFPAFF